MTTAAGNELHARFHGSARVRAFQLGRATQPDALVIGSGKVWGPFGGDASNAEVRIHEDPMALHLGLPESFKESFETVSAAGLSWGAKQPRGAELRYR